MIQRYDIYGYDVEVDKDFDGDWVKWEDVRSLIEFHELELERAFRDGKDAAMGDPDHG